MEAMLVMPSDGHLTGMLKSLMLGGGQFGMDSKHVSSTATFAAGLVKGGVGSSELTRLTPCPCVPRPTSAEPASGFRPTPKVAQG